MLAATPDPTPPAGSEPTAATDVITDATNDALMYKSTRQVVEVAARLTWDPFEPYAVTLLLQARDDPTAQEWLFARELLALGGGQGDVRVEHTPEAVTVILDSPSGHAEIHLPGEWARNAIARIQQAMPLGTEPSVTELTDDEWADELAVLAAKPSE